MALPALAFRGVTVIDVTTGERRADQTVLIVGNRIQTVGSSRAVQLPAGAEVVDARGKYLIPGLWDMHSGANSGSGFIRYGVTGVRQVTMSLEPSIDKSRRVALAGVRLGPPRQSNAYSVVRGSGAFAQDSATAIHLVDSAKALGFDMLETGGENRNNFFVLAAEARRMRLRLGGRIEDSVLSAFEALDSGASLIDHVAGASGGLDRRCVRNADPRYQTATLASCRAAAEQLRRHNAWWVPVLTEGQMMMKAAAGTEPMLSVRSQRILAETFPWIDNGRDEADSARRNWLRNSARFKPAQAPNTPPDTAGVLSLPYKAGMPLLAGTEWAAPFTLHVQLTLMVLEGLSPLAALQSATLNPAKFLRATDSLGTVAPGKLADLVLLDADPLIDITNTTTIEAVVANGRYYDRATLDWM